MAEHNVYESPGEPGKRGFEDLEFYQISLQIIDAAHKLAIKLPLHEKYDLAQQIRRASKSISANIAEGYGRYHYLDSLRFYSIARGSLNETLNHFITARILGYLEESDFQCYYRMVRDCEKSLNGFIAYVRRQRIGHELYGDKALQDGKGSYDVITEADTDDSHYPE